MYGSLTASAANPDHAEVDDLCAAVQVIRREADIRSAIRALRRLNRWRHPQLSRLRAAAPAPAGLLAMVGPPERIRAAPEFLGLA